MRRARAFAVIALGAAVLAGCGSGTDRAQRMTLAALATRPPVITPPPVPPVNTFCGTASLRPPATMPAPGSMPAGSYMARIKQRGYLVAGVDQNTLLLSYFDPSVKGFVGFEIDLLRQVATAIFGNPNDVQFKAITTDERPGALQDGSVDIVADAFTITCARKKLVDFSTVYFKTGQRILVPTNSTAHSVNDLSGQRVCATYGSTSLAELIHLYPRAVPDKVAQRTDCLVALQEGSVAAITSDDAILRGYLRQDPNTRIVGPMFAPDPYGMGISKAHTDFVRFVNGVLAQLRADGGWRAMYRRWFGNPVPAPPAAQYDG